MLTYIAAFILALGIYNEVRFFFIKKRIKKVPEIKKKCGPLLLKGGKRGILFIHGFSSIPLEGQNLATYFNKRGYTVHAPLLTGHGTSPEHMAVSKWHQWIADAEEGLRLLETMCDEIWIIGNSMGGNIGLIISDKSSKVKGVVCFSTPIRFKAKFTMVRYLLPLLRRIKLFQKKIYSKKYAERLKQFKKQTYPIVPLISLAHLYKVIVLSIKRLKEAHIPVMVIQAKPDLYLDERGAEFIHANTRSSKKALLWVENSYHNIIRDEKIGKVKIFKRITEFIAKTT